MKELVKQLASKHTLDAPAMKQLLKCVAHDADTLQDLRDMAVRTAHKQFGRGIYVRGLIELSSYCHRDCLYCGLRRSNTRAERYRLTQEEVLACCDEGYRLGFRTFVLQGGEDATHTDEWLEQLITRMRHRYPEAAITLSLGERSEASYRRLHQAGANRYLLRHEAANTELYNSLHPHGRGQQHRLNCVEALQRTGYQVGMGMMVGVKGQTLDHLTEDLLLMARMRPEMVGIGPFIPHPATPLANEPAGALNLTLGTIAIARLLLPEALIPATTALATLSPTGRTEGILSGANVVMPNLSPVSVRAKYAIYENKASWGAEAAEGLAQLEKELHCIGYHVDYGRGDYGRGPTLLPDGQE
ncbi:MAG: [Bacteroidaceae bacterium]|nr:[FeFe] hydrogenase H-cluster radical SAM maturase HydE [Bacteroidaceae bacterium]